MTLIFLPVAAVHRYQAEGEEEGDQWTNYCRMLRRAWWCWQIGRLRRIWVSVFGNEWKIPVGAGGGKLGAAFVSTEMGCTWKESSCLAKRYL